MDLKRLALLIMPDFRQKTSGMQRENSVFHLRGKRVSHGGILVWQQLNSRSTEGRISARLVSPDRSIVSIPKPTVPSVRESIAGNCPPTDDESALPALLELSYSSPMPEETKRSDDSDEIERSQQTERGDYEDRLRQLETDVKDLLTLFKHLLKSSPHGEQLLFMTLGRIEEQDAAVEKFNETFRDLVKRKGLE